MKVIVIGWLFITLLLTSACQQSSRKVESGNSFDTQEEILNRIVEPVFPDRLFNVLDYGAKDDSLFDSRSAFVAAMHQSAEAGGGRIIVPAGTYFLQGPIHFVDNTELHLSEGAILKFSSEPAHYLPVVSTSWEGTLLYNYSPLIYAYQKKNIALTGDGIIDGDAFKTWQLWHAKQKPDQELSREMNHAQTPVEERVFGEGHYLRPQHIQFYDCKNILVEDVTIKDSPFWCLHLLMCKNVTVRGIKYDAYNKNNDGKLILNILKTFLLKMYSLTMVMIMWP